MTFALNPAGTAVTQFDLLVPIRDETNGAGYQPIDVTLRGLWLTIQFTPTTLPSSPGAGDGLDIGVIVDDRDSTVDDHNPGDPADLFKDWLWWEFLPYTQIVQASSVGALVYPHVRQVKSKRRINHIGKTLWFVAALHNGADDTAPTGTVAASAIFRV